MFHLDSADFYHARERQERALATASGNAAVATIHRTMAARYGVLAGQADLLHLTASLPRPRH